MRLRLFLERVLLFGLFAIPATLTWTVAGVHIAVGLAAAAALAQGLLFRAWPWRRTHADPAAVVFALACIAATLASADRSASFVGSKKLLLLVVIPVAGAALAPGGRARGALRLFVAALALAAVVSMLDFLWRGHAPGARLRGAGHYMTFAGLLLLAWFPAAAAAAATRGRTRLLYAAAVAILGLALLLTFTRSAWIGVVLGGGFMLVRYRPRLLLGLPVVLGLGLALAPGSYRERALSSFDLAHPNNVDRLRLWRAGIDIWRDHPWTGVGLVDLKPVYLQYRHGSEGEVHGHLHDNWLHVLATTGALGLAGFAWLMLAFGRIAWDAGRCGAGAELRALGYGLWGSFWGFQAMGLFEWNFGDVEVTIALYFLLGVAAAMAARGRLARGTGTPSPHAGPRGEGRAVEKSEVEPR